MLSLCKKILYVLPTRLRILAVLVAGLAAAPLNGLTWAGAPDETAPGLVDLPSGARGVLGLRQAPETPVSSVFLRRAFPDHPLGVAPGQAEPGAGGAPLPGPIYPLGGVAQCGDTINWPGTLEGVDALYAQDNIICTNADIDSYVMRETGQPDRTFIVEAGGEEAAWTLTEVTDPSNPNRYGPYCWVRNNACDTLTYTPDVKAFRQGNSHYIALALERRYIGGYCGVVIDDITDPGNPQLQSQFIGADWCDVHNIFVEQSADGEGLYIYATADATNDLRVLDISGDFGGTVQGPVEIGRYTAPTANGNNYVHDVTVIDHGGAVGRRVYLAYWDSGLVILDAEDLTPGTSGGSPCTHPRGKCKNNNTGPSPIIGPNVIDPAGFLTHHAFASYDGSLVFIQDEFMAATGDKPVQMWDISVLESPFFVDGLQLGEDLPENPAHNLEIRFDIDPDRLYSGWYKLGLQAWDFSSSGFARYAPEPTSVIYHRVQTETDDYPYSGAWGVRLVPITPPGPDQLTGIYVFQSDRGYGLIIGCLDEDGDAACDEIASHDVAVTDVRAFPSSLVLAGDTVNVDVDVENLTEFAGEDVDVTLTDATDGFAIGTQAIILSPLSMQMSMQTVNFVWEVPTAASVGEHDLVATATLVNDPDSDPLNNSGNVAVTIDQTPGGTGLMVDDCDPNNGSTNTALTVKIDGSDFQLGATVDFGSKIAVRNVTFVDTGQLVVDIRINKKAATGLRDVTVTNPNGDSSTGVDCFEVN